MLLYVILGVTDLNTCFYIGFIFFFLEIYNNYF